MLSRTRSEAASSLAARTSVYTDRSVRSRYEARSSFPTKPVAPVRRTPPPATGLGVGCRRLARVAAICRRRHLLVPGPGPRRNRLSARPWRQRLARYGKRGEEPQRVGRKQRDQRPGPVEEAEPLEHAHA